MDEDWIIEGIVLAYQAIGWKKMRRVAVFRKMPRWDGNQSQLELDLLWQYEAMVTTEAWEAIDVWHFYNQRCCMENYIKEGKNGFAIHRIPTQSFAANEIDLLLKLLTAYSYLFKIECTFREMKQVIGAFGYCFWSTAMPKINRYRRKNEPDPLEDVTNEQQQKRLRLTLQAIEGFVMCSGIDSIDRFALFLS